MILIIGASSGLGFELTKLFISKKKKIIAVYLCIVEVPKNIIKEKEFYMKKYLNPQKIIMVKWNFISQKKYEEFPHSDVLVYFKGAYGVASGSVEPLVNINHLIELLKKNKFDLVDKSNYLRFNSRSKGEMSEIQKEESPATGHRSELIIVYFILFY